MTSRYVFIADVHLRREELAKRDAFIRYLDGLAGADVRLFLLGDLINVWIGEVQLREEPELVPVFEAMRSFVQRGGRLTYFHGNRDYIMGDTPTRRLGAETVPYWKIINLDGRKTWLNHGDLLCTADQLYHVTRLFMRGSLFRWLFCLVPVSWRYSSTGAYRKISQRRDPARRKAVHGINRNKVKHLCRRGVELIICGHVHEHTDEVVRDGDRRTRVISLPPWKDSGSALEYVDGHFHLRIINFT